MVGRAGGGRWVARVPGRVRLRVQRAERAAVLRSHASARAVPRARPRAPVAVAGRAFHIRGVRAGDRVHVFGQKMRPFSALVPDDAKGKGSEGGSEGTRGPGYSEYSGPSDSEEDYDSEYSDSSKRATSADAGALGSLRVFVPAPHPRDPDPPIIDGFLNVQVVPRGRDAAGREFVRVLLVSDPEAARELDALRRGAGGGAGRESAAPDPDANHPIDDAETNTTRAPRRSRRLFERSTSRAVFGGGGGGDSRRGGALPARARGFDSESAFARFLADLGRVLEGHGRNWLYDEHARAASRRVIAGAEAALSERDAPALLAALRDVADDLDAQEAAEREEEETGGPNASAARHHHLENLISPAGEEAPPFFDDDAVAVARLATRGSGVKPFGDRSEGPEGCKGVSRGRGSRGLPLSDGAAATFRRRPKDPKGRRAPSVLKCSVLDKDPAFRAWYSFHFRSSLVFAGCVLVLAWKSRRWGIAEGDVAAYFGVSMLYPLAFGVPSEALRAGLAKLRRALEGTAVDGVLRGASFELLTLFLVQRSNGALRHRLHGTWNEEWGAKETVTDPRWVVGWACAVANLCVHAMCHARGAAARLDRRRPVLRRLLRHGLERAAPVARTGARGRGALLPVRRVPGRRHVAHPRPGDRRARRAEGHRRQVQGGGRRRRPRRRGKDRRGARRGKRERERRRSRSRARESCRLMKYDIIRKYFSNKQYRINTGV